MTECEFYPCSFVQKLQPIDRILCAGFISVYCTGKEAESCERRRFIKKYEKMPPDTMTPEGKMLPY